MGSDNDGQERIDRLEVRAAFQEQTVEELNAVVLEQWKAIEELRRQVARLEERLLEAERSLPDTGTEPPPPHY